MSKQITLTQFEAINELFNACLHRVDLGRVISHPNATAEYIRNVYFRPEWRLFDACVDVVGYDEVNSYASATECAAIILTDCMTGKIDVVDLEAA